MRFQGFSLWKIIYLFQVALLSGCVLGVDVSKPKNVEKDSADVFILPEVVMTTEFENQTTPEVIEHSSASPPAFLLSIERYGVLKAENTPLSVFEKIWDFQTDVPIIIDGESISGTGHGPGNYSEHGPTCEIDCNFELEYKVTGEFVGAPHCSLAVKISEAWLPGDCVSVCTTGTISYPYAWTSPGTGYPLGPYVFEFETGLIEQDSNEITDFPGGEISFISMVKLKEFADFPSPLYGCDIAPDVFIFTEDLNLTPVPENQAEGD